MAVWGPGIVVPKVENVGSQFLSLRQRFREQCSPLAREAVWAGRGTVFPRPLDLPNGRSGPYLLRWANFLQSLCTFAVRYRAS